MPHSPLADIAAHPRDPNARLRLGQHLHQSGNLPAAEAAYRAGLKLDRGHPGLAITLADLLDATGRPAEAIRTLRTALEARRRDPSIATRLARSLIAAGQSADAIRTLATLASAARPDHAVLAEQAAAYKALSLPDRALATNQRAAALYPESAVAHHNLAAHLGDHGQFAAAEQSAARALAAAGQAQSPQTWLVYARALLGAGKLDESERAFREALRRAPNFLDAHRDLAQLVWMRTADPRAAIATLDPAIQANPHHALFGLRAHILQSAGHPEAAYTTLQQAIGLHPNEPVLHLAAAQLAPLAGQTAHSIPLAERAAALLGNDDAAQTALAAACLAGGDPARAAAIAAGLAARHPNDQRAHAYLATAWRLLGDPRYAALYDYPNLVRAWQMDTPDGWPNLAAYLADLTEALGGLHPYRTHPLGQSVRHGSQATHLLASGNPVIRAFFQAIDGPIRRHVAALGPGTDPLRARNTGRTSFHGAWSVRLRPGGFHADHIHPEGWLSSACYIALPDTPGEGREAWIKFGEPGLPTAPALGAEHFVQPQPGMLVLFPSYMWHGTVPFRSDGVRLSIAFDLVPA